MKMNKLTGLVLLSALAACDINQPIEPRLEGQWQCGNGLAIIFRDRINYTVVSASGESSGVYKLTVGENNYHRIEWNPGMQDAVAPLSSRFRYFESGGLVRLSFYTHVIDDMVPCERRL